MNIRMAFTAKEEASPVKAGLKNDGEVLGVIEHFTPCGRSPKALVRNSCPLKDKPSVRGVHYVLSRLDRLSLPSKDQL